MTPKELAAYADGTYRASAGLIRLAPEDQWEWKPKGHNMMTVGQLCQHLTEATGKAIRGFVTGDWGPPPPDGGKMPTAETLPSCTKQEALELLEDDRLLMHEMLDTLPAEDFDHRIVKAPWGGEGPLWSYCLLMIEHQSNHKMQLFQYLKQIGLEIHTGHLYGM
jgi:hypothetical protein